MESGNGQLEKKKEKRKKNRGFDNYFLRAILNNKYYSRCIWKSFEINQNDPHFWSVR